MGQPPQEGEKDVARARVTVRTEWCKGCAYCAHVCTKGVLQMEGVYPVVTRPEACTGCALCAWICPDFAIEVERSGKRSDGDEGSSE